MFVDQNIILVYFSKENCTHLLRGAVSKYQKLGRLKIEMYCLTLLEA